jgi:molybdate transport system substrate-binding protein
VSEIKVISGGAPQEVLAVLTPEFEKQSGHKVACTFAVMSALQQKLESGEKPDIAIMPVPIIDKYVAAGTMRGDARGTLGRLGIGVIVPEGKPRPAISTPENFRKALLAAETVVHATPGATPSGTHLGKVMEQLGVAGSAKIVHRPALEGGVDLVAKGEAGIGMYPISEVINVKGVAVVGPLPQSLQLEIVYGIAVLTGAAAPDAAFSFVKFLTAPDKRARWAHAGFEPA